MRNNCGLISTNASIELMGVFNNFIKTLYKKGAKNNYARLEDKIAEYLYDKHRKDDKNDALTPEESHFIEQQFILYTAAVKPILTKSRIDTKFAEKIWGDSTAVKPIELFLADVQKALIEGSETTLTEKVKNLYEVSPEDTSLIPAPKEELIPTPPLEGETKITKFTDISNKMDLKEVFANANTAYLLLERRVSNHIVRNYLINQETGVYNSSSNSVDKSVKANKTRIYKELIKNFEQKGIKFVDSERDYYVNGRINDNIKSVLDRIADYYKKYDGTGITNIKLEEWTQNNINEISDFINFVTISNFDNLLLSYGKGIFKISDSYLNSANEKYDEPKYVLDIASNINDSIFQTGEYNLSDEQSSLFKMFISSMPSVTFDKQVSHDKEIDLNTVNTVMAKLLHGNLLEGAPIYDPTNSMESMKALLEFAINNFTGEGKKIKSFDKIEKDTLLSVYMYFFRNNDELTTKHPKVLLNNSLRSAIQVAYGNDTESGFKNIPSFYHLASNSEVISGMDYFNVIVSNFDKTYLNEYTEYTYDKDRGTITVNSPTERLINSSEIQFTNNLNNFINQEFNKTFLENRYKDVTIEGKESDMPTVRFELSKGVFITANLANGGISITDGIKTTDSKALDFKISPIQEQKLVEILNKILPQLQLRDDKGNDFYYPLFTQVFSPTLDDHVEALTALAKVAGYVAYTSSMVNEIGKDGLLGSKWMKNFGADKSPYIKDDEEFSIARMFPGYSDIAKNIGKGLSIINGETHKAVIKVGNVTVPTIGEVRHLYALPKWRNWLIKQNGNKLTGMPIASNLFMRNPDFLKGFKIRSFVKSGDNVKHSSEMAPLEIATTFIMHDYIAAANKYNEVYIQSTVFADKNSHNSVVVKLNEEIQIPGITNKISLSNVTATELKQAAFLNNATYYKAISDKLTSTYIPVLQTLLPGTTIESTLQGVHDAMSKVQEQDFRNAFYKHYNGSEYIIEDLGIEKNKKDGTCGLSPLLIYYTEMYTDKSKTTPAFTKMMKANELLFAKSLNSYNMNIEYMDGKGSLNPLFIRKGTSTIFDTLKIADEKTGDRITKENFEKNWVDPSTKYLTIYKGGELNPLLRHYFYMDNYISENLSQASMGTIHNHPFKGKAKAKPGTFEFFTEIESAKTAAMYKRQLQGTPMKPLNLNLINGVRETMSSVFLTDINNPVYTSFGIKDKMTVTDGSAQVTPLQYILQNNSLLENSVGPNAKMFSLFMDPKYNSYGLTKYAEFGITNEMIQNSKGSTYDLMNLIEKSYRYKPFTRSITIEEFNPNTFDYDKTLVQYTPDILKDFKGNNITIETIAPNGLFYVKNDQVYEIKSLTRGTTITQPSGEVIVAKGESNDFQVQAINLTTGMAEVPKSVKINDLFDLWQALGAENSVSIDKEGQYSGSRNPGETLNFTESDASHYALAEFVNRVGHKMDSNQKVNLINKYGLRDLSDPHTNAIYSKETEANFVKLFPEFKVNKTDFKVHNQTNTWQPLKAMFIGKYIHTSAQKSGAINVHNIDDVYNQTKPIYPVDVPAISTGLLMTTEHEVEGSEITKMTQIYSAIEFMGDSHNVSSGVYNAIADVLNIKLKSLFDATEFQNVNKEALYKEVTDNLIRTFNSKDQQSIGKFIGQMVERNSDEIKAFTAQAKEAEAITEDATGEEPGVASTMSMSIVRDGKRMPFSTYMYSSFISLMSNFLNKEAIKDKQSGIASPIKPSGGMLQVYDSEDINGKKDVLLRKNYDKLNAAENIVEAPITIGEISLNDWVRESDGKTMKEYQVNTPEKLIALKRKDTGESVPVQTFKGFWTRGTVQNDTNNVYLFGDNTNDRMVTKYIPGATQAVIRGLPNAIGIDTKRDRGTTSKSFLTDADLPWFKSHVDEQLKKAQALGKPIILPEDGIGTGKAMLKEKAPALFAYLNEALSKLETTKPSKVKFVKLYGKPRDLQPPLLTFKVIGKGMKESPMSIYELPDFAMVYDYKEILEDKKPMTAELGSFLTKRFPGENIEKLMKNTKLVNNALRVNIQSIFNRIDTQHNVLINGKEYPVEVLTRSSGEAIGPNIYRTMFDLPKGTSVNQVTEDFLFQRMYDKSKPAINDKSCYAYVQNPNGNHIYIFNKVPTEFTEYTQGKQIKEINGQYWVVDGNGDPRYIAPSGLTGTALIGGKRVEVIVTNDLPSLQKTLQETKNYDKSLQTGRIYNVNENNDAILKEECAILAKKRFSSFRTTLNYIAARIPGQGFQSFTDLKLVDFIHTEGNTVMTNHFTSWLKGEDYDIDKGFWLGLTLKNGIVVGWANEFDYSSEESLIASMSLPYPDKKWRSLDTEDSIDDPAEVTLTNEEVDSLFEENMSKLRSDTLVKLGNIDNYNFLGENHTAYEVQEKVNEYFMQTIPLNAMEDAVKNKMAWGIRDAVVKPVNLNHTESPIGMEELRDEATEANRVVSNNNPMSKADFQYANMVGKNVIGIAAVALKIWSAASFYGNDKVKKGEFASILMDKNLKINGKNRYIASQANLNFSAKASTVITDEYIADQVGKNNIEENCNG